MSEQQLAKDKEVIVPKLSGDKWFDVPEVKSVDQFVVGDLVMSGHRVISDVKTAFQPVISDVIHDKVTETVTSDNGHENVSEFFKESDFVSQ